MFVDTDCQTRRCFKGIDMEVRRTEDLVPTLMDLAMVPVTKGSAKFVGGAISKSHLQEEDEFVPNRGRRSNLVGILKYWSTLGREGVLWVRRPVCEMSTCAVGKVS